jgi:hypothetical protein
VYDYAVGKMAWLACGLPFEGSASEDTRVGAIARTDVPTCRIGERLGDLPLSARDWGLCVVANQEGCVTGVIRSGAFALGPDARRPGHDAGPEHCATEHAQGRPRP